MSPEKDGCAAFLPTVNLAANVRPLRRRAIVESSGEARRDRGTRPDAGRSPSNPSITLEGRPVDPGLASEGRRTKPGLALEDRSAEPRLALEDRLQGSAACRSVWFMGW
jgi:hypothetical protein